MNPAARKLVESVAPRLAYWLIRFLRATMRAEYRQREVLARAREKSGQYILVFWHSRFVMMPYAYPDRRLVVLLSRHRDARMLAKVMASFGLAQASGSTTAGGATGVRQLLRMVRDGHDVGIAPDGPRGPRRRCQVGAIATARLTGKPIIPVAFSARPARRLRSWDRTLVPYPFARGLYIYGEPLEVPREADDAEQERLRQELEARLNRLTDRADAEVGIPPEEPRSECPA